jgi:hypothetical protein
MAYRSKRDSVDENLIDKLRNELGDILDSGILSYPETLSQVGLQPEMTLQERKKILEVDSSYTYREDEKVFLKDMANKAISMRKANWTWRISEEAEEKNKLGWYPFFVTLTIDPKVCDGKERKVKSFFGKERVLPGYTDPKDIWTEGREFRRYIRDLADVVCTEMGHKLCRHSNVPESEYVTYAGVIEHGKSRQHHHGHFVIWLRSIPSRWRVCPNAGIIRPENRVNNTCAPMCTLWPWSVPRLSPALYFRTVNDVWEREYNFVLPLNPKDGNPLKVSVPRVAGFYITKYLQKGHKEWKHRMKATRNLGMNRLKKVISRLSQEKVEALTWRPENSDLNLSLTRTHSAPLGLVRSLAKQRLYLLKFLQNQMDLKMLLTSNSDAYKMMLSSVRSGARPDRMHSSEFFDWIGQFLPEEEGYCRDKLIKAHSSLVLYFPPQSRDVNHVKIGANKRGYT